MSGWEFYATTLLVYLGVDIMAVWGLNLQYGVAGVYNFGFVVFQALGAYVAAVDGVRPAVNVAAASRPTSSARTSPSPSRSSRRVSSPGWCRCPSVGSRCGGSEPTTRRW